MVPLVNQLICQRDICISETLGTESFGPLGQSACLGAGCYIKMATSYHQPSEYELDGG